MGYAESQAASQYNGLCITCHVKQRVQTKIITAKDPGMSTTQRSTENVFNKFQDMLVTTESTINIRIKARCGVITTDFHYEFKRTTVTKRVWNFLRKKPEQKSDFLQHAIEMAMLELKAKAIRLDANAIIGLSVDCIVLGDFKKNGLIVSLVGTGIKI
jgi:uncharacterized protein YbjQ (UPF0145 family)